MGPGTSLHPAGMDTNFISIHTFEDRWEIVEDYVNDHSTVPAVTHSPVTLDHLELPTSAKKGRRAL